MFDSSDAYFKFLKRQKGKILYLYPYVGNSGDSLIRMGTLRLLAELGISSTVDPKKADIILWPGGNPTMWCANVDGWRTVLQTYDHAKFVVGPATFQLWRYDWAAVIRCYSQRVIALFARDAVSYRNLTSVSLPSHIELGLGDDPSLYLRGSDWVESHKAAATAEYVLAAFRADHEGCTYRGSRSLLAWTCVPGGVRARLDRRAYRRSQRTKILSVAQHSNVKGDIKVADVAQYDFDSFVDAVRRASEVHTDRLHTMLLAVLFGKRVFAYPTSYAKLEAVYCQSLKDWATVEFVGDRVGPLPAQPVIGAPERSIVRDFFVRLLSASRK
jgi:exopolysaccharide biosynthesis predicted pyruvyltransferase EpsI